MIRGFVSSVCALSLALVTQVAGAQVDPESGDTGQGWEPPPPPAEQSPPPAEQPPPAQSGGGWQAPPAGGQAGGQPAWFNRDGERPPGMGTSESSEQPTEEAPAGETDHDRVSLGIAYFGINRLAITPTDLGDRTLNLNLATVGIRYWLGTVGLDIGVGVGSTSRKNYNTCLDAETGAIDCNAPRTRTSGLEGVFGLGLHVGLPIAAATSRHATLLVIPEIDFAYGKGTLIPDYTADTAFDIDITGLRFDVGLRVGGEFQFGAIGLPNLSLQLTVGLGLRWSSQSASNKTAATDPGALGFDSTNLEVRTVANDLLNGLVRLNYYF